MPDTHPAPAEGLPPNERMPACLRLHMFEGRAAILRDGAADCGNVHGGERFYVVFGIIASCDGQHDHVGPSGSHDLPWCFTPSRNTLLTDDPDEAARAYERGAEWVRTGEMA